MGRVSFDEKFEMRPIEIEPIDVRKIMMEKEAKSRQEAQVTQLAQPALKALSDSHYGKNLNRKGYDAIMDALFKLYRIETE